MVTAGSIPERRLSRATRTRLSLVAATALLGSAALQGAAARERWVVVGGAWSREDVSIEDGRFDYVFPADPWENVGAAAQLYGAGLVLAAVAVFVLGVTVAGRAGADRLVTTAIAATFGLNGVHAAVSAVLGAPSPLAFVPLFSLLSTTAAIGLAVMAARWMRRAPLTALALLLLIWLTMPGYLVASFQIAPAIMGYQSHDTTPGSEAVAAVATAAAGAMVLFAAVLDAVTARTRGRGRPSIT